MDKTIITPVVEEKKETKNCPHCNGAIPLDYNFCTFCGKSTIIPTEEEVKRDQEQSRYYKEYMKVMKQSKTKKLYKILFISGYSISGLMLLIGMGQMLFGSISNNVFGVDTVGLFSNMTKTICSYISSFMFAFLGSFFYKIYIDINKK